MPDHATSNDPAVQAQLNRLWTRSPGADVLGLGRITELLARLGDPHRHLPPVLHVAGTNGKGSTCAFLRAMLEAAGLRVHAYTSPHLVRFNERIRLAGTLIDDAALAPLLGDVLDASDGIGASFFEVTTAAAFLAFSRTPADACIVEVGLGGRLDATNVIPTPIVCGIASLGIDHEGFLLMPEAGTPPAPIDRIAFEKAGIAKPGVPLVTQAYPASVVASVAQVANDRAAPLFAGDDAWHATISGDAIEYGDARGRLALPLPALIGAYQAENAALAVAMLRHQSAIDLPFEALATGIRSARWPARMQRLARGPLVDRLAGTTPVFIDGAHNRSAAQALRSVWRPVRADERVALVIGMLANKDAVAVLDALATPAGWCEVIAVPIPGHDHHRPEQLADLARAGGAAAGIAESLTEALDQLANKRHDRILIAGSLYLAGEALRQNDELLA